MAFPQSALGVTVGLYLGGSWVDVSTDALHRDAINIQRGQSDEGSQADPSSCTLTLKNQAGTYSPRNPLSAYYGIIGRNTPLRVSVNEGTPYLATQGTQFANTGASTPDAAALDITGDIDIRIDVTMANWLTVGTSSSVELAGKFRTSGGNQRSWLFMMRNGRPWFEWSADGTNVLQKTSTADLTIPSSGRLALRVTLDVNNGAAGNTVTFYTSDTISGTWTQLGDPVVTAGTTSIFNSTAELRVGDGSTDIGFYTPDGGVHAFQLRNGIAGSVVANPDFTAQALGATSFADAAGRTWTVNNYTSISNRRFRFHGEVSSWPQRWDPSGNDVYTPIEAAGILRRLGQGAPELRSTLYRGLTTLSTNKPVAYWPAEDEEGSTTIASGLGGPPMTIVGTPGFGDYEGFAASAPIPLLNDSEWTGIVPGYAVSSQLTMRFLLAVPTGGSVNAQSICKVLTSGSAPSWEVVYGTGGTLRVVAKDEEGTILLDSGYIAFNVNGAKLRVALDLLQNGANVEWDLTTVEPGQTGVTTGGTLNNQTFGQAKRVIVNNGGGITDTAVGHVSIQPGITSVYDLADQLNAYIGEKPARRFWRLCQEENIPFRLIGHLDDGELMGAQTRSTLVSLLTEVAETDLGIMFEPRDLFGLGYRTRESLYNTSATVALDYDAEQVSIGLEPVDDDQATRNDITVTREGGSSARAMLETGPLSTQAPPNGVGPYPSSVTIAAMSDQQLPDQASWRLHLGTVDEARYPQVTMNLANAALSSNAALSAAVRALEVGDRLTIANLPSWLPPELVSQLVYGFDELLDNFANEIVVNCVPDSPYQVGVYGTARYGPYASTLAEDLTTTETGADVATTAGPLWTTAAGDLPLDIMVGGERMTVTAISGASSPQTFTVTRSVNGIVKTHLTGAAVQLFTPSYRAL